MTIKKRRSYPSGGDRLTDFFFRMIVGILDSISVRKAREIYNPKNRHEKNICGIISADRAMIYLNVARHKKINEPIVSTLVHEVLHVMMPGSKERRIHQLENILYIRLTDSQKRYLRARYIPKHITKAHNIDSA
ncbi:MAG: hypothetical protein AAB362_00955 [Patescibacteria group bacterium]